MNNELINEGVCYVYCRVHMMIANTGCNPTLNSFLKHRSHHSNNDENAIPLEEMKHTHVNPKPISEFKAWKETRILKESNNSRNVVKARTLQCIDLSLDTQPSFLLTSINQPEPVESFDQIYKRTLEDSVFIEEDLMQSLKSELMDIITTLQSERITQLKEIAKLNDVIKEKVKSEEVSKKRIRELEEMLEKLNIECNNLKVDLENLKKVVKEKDKKITKMGNYSQTKSLIASKGRNLLRESMVHSLEQSKDQLDLEKNYEATLKSAQDEIKRLQEELKEKNSELLRSRQKIGKVTISNKATLEELNIKLEDFQNSVRHELKEKTSEDLIEQIKKLEDFISKQQGEYQEKIKEYINSIKCVEEEIKAQCVQASKIKGTSTSMERVLDEVRQLKSMLSDIDQNYLFQTACNKSIQEGSTCYNVSFLFFNDNSKERSAP